MNEKVGMKKFQLCQKRVSEEVRVRLFFRCDFQACEIDGWQIPWGKCIKYRRYKIQNFHFDTTSQLINWDCLIDWRAEMLTRTSNLSGMFRHICQSLPLKATPRRMPSGTAAWRRNLCSKLSEENREKDNTPDNTPNLIYYGLYSTLCYSGVYVGTLATLYMAVSHGYISADTFDIDQLESASKVHVYLSVWLYECIFVTVSSLTRACKLIRCRRSWESLLS
jgi:hypothetical protein